MKSRKKTYAMFGIASGLIALAAAAMPSKPKPLAPPQPAPQPLVVVAPPPAPVPPAVVEPPPPPKPETPKVEVVFALDTTGSMEGLIEGAKRKIWNIANYIGNAQPKPEVRIGLVGYRDIGDEYVTRFYDLSDDLDTVFKHLSQFRAAGGGDTPEHVGKALHDAVERTSWSSGEKVVKIVYLVGDAAPHTDYHDGYDYRAISRKAARRGIHVNTILCGRDRDAMVAWNEIARAGSGEYASIAQSGGVATVATPYDSKLADLNRRLTGTAIGWGSEGRRREVAAKAAASMAAPAPMAADRAGYAASKGLAVSGEGDLVNDIAAGKAKIGSIPTGSLPEPMRTMSPAAQGAFVAEKQAERQKVINEINEQNRLRNDYLKAESKKSKRDDGFDDRVRKSLAKDAEGVLAF